MFSWNQLHRGVKAIFFVQVVNRMGDFVVPFLTLILTQVQGLKPAQAGLVVSLATALGSAGGLVAGRMGDLMSRRDVLSGFLAVSGLLLAFAGFAPASPGALVAIVASQFFVGAMRPTLGALVADLSDPATRRAAFSLSYLGINLGVAVGPLLAGWLFQHSMNWLFWLDALSTAAGLVILIRFVPRVSSVPSPSRGAATSSVPPSSVRAFFRHPVLFPFSLLVLIYNLVYSQMIFTLALQLVELFGERGPPTFGLVWAVNALAVLVLTPVALRVTKKLTNLDAMAAGLIVVGAGVAVFLFHPSLLWVLISAVLWTAGEVLFSIHYGEFVTVHSPQPVRARFQAYVGFVGSLGFVASPLLSGLVTQSLGLTGVWAGTTILAFAVGFAFAVLKRQVKP